MGGFIFGALGGLMIALAFTKFENYQQFRWTIKLLCFGVGLGLLAQTSTLGGLIANLIFFPIAFGFIGGLVDFVKSRNKENKTSIYEPPTKAKTSTTERSEHIAHTKVSPQPKFENMTSNSKSDDSLWAEALEEFESKSRIKGLYAKLYTQNDGDEQRIKSAYLKERFEQLKSEQQNLLAKEAELVKENNEHKKKLQLTQQERKLALENKENKKITSIEVVGNIEFYMFEDGRVAIKANESDYALYVNFKAAENAVNYSNLYGIFGFIGLITINNDKVVISCPRCNQKTRVPSNKELEITCPSCKFQWREKT